MMFAYSSNFNKGCQAPGEESGPPGRTCISKKRCFDLFNEIPTDPNQKDPAKELFV
jgi:hypothetical protein